VTRPSYTYRIIDSPLPVADYQSTIDVADAGGTTIIWAGAFDGKDASDADAVGVIEGIYQGGLDSLGVKPTP
jgi:Polyketide cyclase / dehydrase and lipid transport